MRGVRAWIAVVAVVAWSACDMLTAPLAPTSAGGEPHFLEQADEAPPLETYEASFWAVRGETRSLGIRYLTGEEFLRLTVGSDALLRGADGTSFVAGDSVLITATIDRSLFVLHFEPVGLAFSSSEPATLSLHYFYADPDLDRDGGVDAADADIEALYLGIWRRPDEQGQWRRITADHVRDSKRFHANLLGFSHFAVAW